MSRALPRIRSWEAFTRCFKAMPDADQMHNAHVTFFMSMVDRHPASFQVFIHRIRKTSFPNSDDTEKEDTYGAASQEVHASLTCRLSAPRTSWAVRSRVCPNYTVSL
eukprot:Skav235610  [mRNA]  locus=scaffold358:11777:12097:+ [translate_table: standard]